MRAWLDGAPGCLVELLVPAAEGTEGLQHRQATANRTVTPPTCH